MHETHASQRVANRMKNDAINNKKATGRRRKSPLVPLLLFWRADLRRSAPIIWFAFFGVGAPICISCNFLLGARAEAISATPECVRIFGQRGDEKELRGGVCSLYSIYQRESQTNLMRANMQIFVRVEYSTHLFMFVGFFRVQPEEKSWTARRCGVNKFVYANKYHFFFIHPHRGPRK